MIAYLRKVLLPHRTRLPTMKNQKCFGSAMAMVVWEGCDISFFHNLTWNTSEILVQFVVQQNTLVLKQCY